MPIPGRVGRHFKRRESIWGVCWFHPNAKEAISRARYCAWLIEEGGLPVRSITSRREREVLWRDEHQIVAKPTDDLPKAFGRGDGGRHHTPSAMISRPISQRRISLVPAPIS
ncbi:hypothetical protein A9K66_22375 [Mesorhizobium sp. AA23]|nr:hypothetical protein A9K66_22375 [Mesorhizobium sp. AA23]